MARNEARYEPCVFAVLERSGLGCRARLAQSYDAAHQRRAVDRRSLSRVSRDGLTWV